MLGILTGTIPTYFWFLTVNRFEKVKICDDSFRKLHLRSGSQMDLHGHPQMVRQVWDEPTINLYLR